MVELGDLSSARQTTKISQTGSEINERFKTSLKVLRQLEFDFCLCYFPSNVVKNTWNQRNFLAAHHQVP